MNRKYDRACKRAYDKKLIKYSNKNPRLVENNIFVQRSNKLSNKKFSNNTASQTADKKNVHSHAKYDTVEADRSR